MQSVFEVVAHALGTCQHGGVVTATTALLRLKPNTAPLTLPMPVTMPSAGVF